MNSTMDSNQIITILPLFYFLIYKKMKKNFLFAMLAVFLAWAWFGGISMAVEVSCPGVQEPEGTPTVKANEAVAQIWQVCYESLNSAIEASDGDTITLLKDVNENITIPSWKTVILNLWWYKLSNNWAAHTITNNWELTVISWTVDNTVHGRWAIVNNESTANNNEEVATENAEETTEAEATEVATWDVAEATAAEASTWDVATN